MTLATRPQLEELQRQPTAHVSERALWHGYGGSSTEPLRTVGCACGGEISAIDGDQADIAAAVAVHNRSNLHAAWRRR